jgi:hypothetical protein
MAELKEIAETLVNLTIKEVSELAKILEEDYDIKPAAAAPVAMAVGGAAGGGDAAGGAEEKTEFDVMLNSAGAAKLKVVKEVLKSFQEFFQLETTPENRMNEGLVQCVSGKLPHHGCQKHLRAGIPGLLS